jgi:2,3-bisphosphoglycerate-independent phosphoglycerate mutase
MKHKFYKKIVLVILDGFGVATPTHGNAITMAHIPELNYLVSNFPAETLQASGPLVGLPWGEMGNSEVGHLNIGAGRIVGQDLPRITTSIQNGEFFKVPAFLQAVEHTKKHNSALHLMGLVSSGGVHSFDEHVYALLGLAAEAGQKNVFIHMFTDGRDTEEKAAMDELKKLRERIARIGVGKIASITGRFYAMDRGGHWDQVRMTYLALTQGQGEKAATAEQCILQNYTNGVFDEMIKPTVITEPAADGSIQPVATIASNDAVVFFNFRSDRAIQMTQMFTQSEIVPEQFRQPPLQNLFFVTMTEYLKNLPVHVAYPQMDLKNNLPQVISRHGFTQFHIAESEKYAHVTVFFNCGVSDPLPGEDRTIITSPNNGRNYVDQPQMSAEELTDALTAKITGTNTNFFVANYANADVVGHTGKLEAAVKAVQSLDACIKKIVQATLLVDAVLIITADHGNVEQMINFKTGEVDKDHTTNPVPLLLIANEFKYEKGTEALYASLASKVPAGAISDIAPTILDLFGLPKPPEMSGINLLDEMEEQT